MTELQMSLIGGAVVFVGAVFVYNKWQEHKARKSVERAFSSEHDDVLMRSGAAPESSRHEPSFDLGAPAGGNASRLEPELDEPVSVAAAGDPVTAAERATSLVDPLIDCLIPLQLEIAVRGDKILPALQTLRHVGNKPIHYIGLAVSGDWEPVTHGGVYTKLQAGVQMASRTTALNELEYSELVTRLRTLADEIGAEPEIPDMIEVMGEAKTLHRFV
ncbi:MAG: cell division protein, partial [Massilia sp.]|nr:cell division protein [Massilia sp.]